MEKPSMSRPLLDDGRMKQLISFVEKNPDLWIIDPKDYLIKKGRRAELWAEIAAEVDCTAAEARNCWFNQRKNFRKKIRLHLNGSAKAKKKLEGWIWWIPMQFIADHIIETLGNDTSVKPKKRRRKDDSEDEDEVEEEEQNPDDDVANPEEEGKDNQEVVDETSAENETGDNVKLGVADRNDVPSSIDSSASAMISRLRSKGKKKAKLNMENVDWEGKLALLNDLQERSQAKLVELKERLKGVKEADEDEKFGNYVKVILSNHKEPDKMILKSKIRRAITQFFVEQSADHLGGAAAAAADNGLPVSLNQ